MEPTPWVWPGVQPGGKCALDFDSWFGQSPVLPVGSFRSPQLPSPSFLPLFLPPTPSLAPAPVGCFLPGEPPPLTSAETPLQSSPGVLPLGATAGPPQEAAGMSGLVTRTQGLLLPLASWDIWGHGVLWPHVAGQCVSGPPSQEPVSLLSLLTLAYVSLLVLGSSRSWTKPHAGSQYLFLSRSSS